MNYFKPISISLSPNVEKDDVKLALNLIIRPWLWKRGRNVQELENEFKKYLGVKYAVSFNSGRSAFYAILKALNLPEQSNVAIQAFTCNAVPNPVLWAGLNPVYIDCNTDNFNINIEDLKKKLDGLIRTNGSIENLAIVVQHTFGLPANMDEVNLIVRQYNLILIEDCAHSLGAEWKGQKVGTFGRAGFFSFSRDKVISSVYGGMAVTNNDELGKKLFELQKQFGQASLFWTFQQILHPILLNYLVLPLYNFLDLGKILLVFSQWAHILSKAVSWKEKRGERPDYFPRALPNALSAMALHQFGKLDKFYSHRRKIFDFYKKELAGTSFVLPQDPDDSKQSCLRFTVKHPDAHDIIYEAWHKENILIGDWYTTCIAPFDTKLDEVKYSLGSCQNAEYLAQRTINLPTHINIKPKDAQRIVDFLGKFKKHGNKRNNK